MQVSKRQIPQIILLIVLILSAISLVDTTMNYVDFCAALANFQLRVDAVDFVVDGSNLEINIDFTISNPTRYGGFLLGSVYATLYYEGEPHNVTVSPGGPRVGTPYQVVETRWWELPPNEVDVARQVLPYAVISISTSRRVTGDDAKIFMAYLEKQSNQNNIQFRLDTRVFLVTSTFLGTTSLEFPDLYYP